MTELPVLPLPIRTPRLLLRDFEPDDWRSVRTYNADPQFVRYLLWGPEDEQGAHAFVDRCLAWAQERPRWRYELAVVRLADGVLVGSCGLDLSSPDEASLGYGIAPAYWGAGYATEAARALVSAAFQQLRLHRVTATCQPENIASAHVLEKLGMTREGRLRRHDWQRDHWRDSYLYAVLEDEWPAGSPA